MKSSRLLIAAAASLSLVACQRYEADAVIPAAAQVTVKTPQVGHQLSPNVMLVVDRSGSMDRAADGNGGDISACQRSWDGRDGGVQRTACKWDQLVAAMTGDADPTTGFVGQLSDRAGQNDPIRLGLVTFGADAACGAPMGTQVDIAANTAAAINQALFAIPPQGGTPTVAAMKLAAGAFSGVSEDGRSNFIVLVTDGAPDCNGDFVPDNQNNQCLTDGTQSGECASPGGCIDRLSGAHEAQFPLGCLDEDNLVNEVAQIAEPAPAGQGIKTFVIGFGSDLSGGSSRAYETLDRTAVAGGEAQAGEPSFYQAGSQTDLQAALDAILQIISSDCKYQVDKAPPSASAVEVVVTDASGTATVLAPSQYSVSGNTVSIDDANVCSELNASTTASPVTLTINSLAE